MVSSLQLNSSTSLEILHGRQQTDSTCTPAVPQTAGLWSYEFQTEKFLNEYWVCHTIFLGTSSILSTIISKFLEDKYYNEVNKFQYLIYLPEVICSRDLTNPRAGDNTDTRIFQKLQCVKYIRLHSHSLWTLNSFLREIHLEWKWRRGNISRSFLNR